MSLQKINQSNVPYSNADQGEGGNKECSRCLKFISGVPVNELKCHHGYHNTCLLLHLMFSEKTNTTCYMCDKLRHKGYVKIIFILNSWIFVEIRVGDEFTNTIN